ncbi:MAG TPA: GNAT family N-acetyltransferase [Solirubrobacteraceae bacterium]
MIEGIDHLQLAAPPGCEQQAREFFAGVLGMEEIEKPAPLSARGGVWFRCRSGQHLHVGVEDAFVPAQKAHPALLVAADGIDELAERVANAGGPVRWDEELPAMRRFYTADPFGNRLELTTVAVAISWLAPGGDLDGALVLRARVFCDEQGVSLEEERDGRDDDALHLLASVGGRVVGTLRLLLDDGVAKVGRVAVERVWRRRGIAARMLALALEEARAQGAREARLAAQTDAIALYEQAGFEVVSEEFLDAGIVHVWMSMGLGQG